MDKRKLRFVSVVGTLWFRFVSVVDSLRFRFVNEVGTSAEGLCVHGGPFPLENCKCRGHSLVQVYEFCDSLVAPRL